MKRQTRLAPINTGLYVEGESTAANKTFFESRACSSVDICMVGNIAVSEKNVPNSSSGVMSPSNCWAQLASAIRCAGSLPGVQLSATLPGHRGQRAFTAANQDEEHRLYHRLFNEMAKKDWEALAHSFCGAVDLAFKHGFQHIQVHAAHGYAFSLVLDPVINPDQVGLGELSGLLRYVCGKFGNQSSLRVSWFTGLDYDTHRQEKIIDFWAPFAHSVELDLSNGYYNLNKHLIYPPHALGEAPYLCNAISLAQKFPRASFVIAGNIWNPNGLADRCPPNIRFALGRALIADPNHLDSPRSNSTMLCDDCGDCHFFSRGGINIRCPKWANGQTSAHPEISNS